MHFGAKFGWCQHFCPKVNFFLVQRTGIFPSLVQNNEETINFDANTEYLPIACAGDVWTQTYRR
jgi:hypothetical protein